MTDRFDMTQLRSLEGLWKGRGEIAANPWGGAGPCRGRWSFRFDPARQNLIHDYEETRADGAAFNGHGVFCADESGEDLLWFWFDTYGFPPLAPARGGFRRDLLVLTRTTPRGLGRATFRLNGDSFEYLIEAHPAGQPGFSEIMHGIYTRT